MADTKKTAGKTATEKTPVEVTENNVLEELRAKNLVNQSAVDGAIAKINKDQEERLQRQAENAILESQYTNMKKLLELRKRRQEAEATKKSLTASKEALDKLLAGEITPTEYKDMKKKFCKEERDAFNTIDNDYEKASKELRNAFPNSWSYDWENRY